MKERMDLEGVKCEAHGHVSIKYTDPTTSKIREKIEGKNHIFKDVVFCSELERFMNNVPLFITDAASPIDKDLMLARGKAIGYGIPNNPTDNGAHKGSWSADESYRAKPLSDGVSSKYTYQFYPNQALGNIGSISLTNQFYHGNVETCAPYKLAWAQERYSGQSHQRGVCMRKEYAYGFVENMTESSKRIWKAGKNYPLPAVQYSDVASFVTDHTSWNLRITCNPANGRMYVLQLFGPSSTSGRVKLYEFEDDTFTTLLASRDIQSIPTQVSLIGYYPIGVYNNKIIFAYTSGSSYFYIVAVDIQGNNHIPKNLTPTINHIFSYRTETNLHFQSGKYTYLSDPIPSTTYQYNARPVINLDTLELETWYSHGNWPLCIHPHVDGSAVMGAHSTYPMRYWGAAAVYTVPDDAPQRPPGYGMTVSYELEIKY